MAANILDDQVRLSEQLELLNQFRYSDLHMPYDSVGQFSTKDIRDHDTNTAIRLLDTIAVALTTGKSGEVFAAAFDKRQGLTLVLAKNDLPTAEDDQAVQDLINAIMDSSTADAYDVFPFLFPRCGENIKKRLTKMVEAVAAFSHDLEEFLKGYTSLAVKEEFPNSKDYRDKEYRGGIEPPFPQMMRNLLADITSTAQGFDAQNVDHSSHIFVKLAVLAPILQKSRLLRSLCENPDRLYINRKLQAEKLSRRLAKVCQYYLGVNSLIRHAKRLFPDGINYHFVDDITSTGETTITLDDDYLEPTSRALGRTLSREDIATLRERFPDMAESWRNSCFLKTRIHAEIRIVLHLSEQSGALDQNQQAIGCSKRSCLCCALWMAAYNRTFRTQWMTSGSHGKPYATWALPGTSSVDKDVLRGVEMRLTDVLVWLLPDQEQRRISDNHRSSGSEPDEMEALLRRRFREAV